MTLKKVDENHTSAAFNIGGEVDLVGELCDVHLEPLLHLVQNLGVRLLGHQGDGQTLQI